MSVITSLKKYWKPIVVPIVVATSVALINNYKCNTPPTSGTMPANPQIVVNNEIIPYTNDTSSRLSNDKFEPLEVKQKPNFSSHKQEQTETKRQPQNDKPSYNSGIVIYGNNNTASQTIITAVPVPRNLTEEVFSDIVKHLPDKSKDAIVSYHYGNQECTNYALQIINTLKKSGYNVIASAYGMPERYQNELGYFEGVEVVVYPIK